MTLLNKLFLGFWSVFLIFNTSSNAQVVVRNYEEMLCSIDQERMYYTSKDTVRLGPFELYLEAMFVDADFGLGTSFNFKDLQTGKQFCFPDYSNENIEFYLDSLNSQFDENSNWKGKEVLLIFSDESRFRLNKSKIFRIICTFESDSYARDGIPTCLMEGYQFSDIVPRGQKFKRQRNWMSE
ncbi:MAG: hypothetical protein ACK5CY_09245 [Bacteroidia bacterium]|jgi:hypothetical protein